MKCAYVYYRIDPEQVDAATTRIDALLNVMAMHCSQPPRRLNRCDDQTMWMEIYEGITDFATFGTSLKMAVEAFNCAEFTLGKRNLECFSAPTPSH